MDGGNAKDCMEQSLPWLARVPQGELRSKRECPGVRPAAHGLDWSVPLPNPHIISLLY